MRKDYLFVFCMTDVGWLFCESVFFVGTELHYPPRALGIFRNGQAYLKFEEAHES